MSKEIQDRFRRCLIEMCGDIYREPDKYMIDYPDTVTACMLLGKRNIDPLKHFKILKSQERGEG